MPRPKNPIPPRKSNRQPHLKTRGVYGDVKLEAIPFDDAVDCPPYACFNCRVVDEHLSKDCAKPVLYKYCINCGRRGLDVFDCPRCGKGFIEQHGRQPYGRVDIDQPVSEEPIKVERKLPVGMTPLLKKKKNKTKSSSSSSSQSSERKIPKKDMHQSNSTINSTMGSEVGDECLIFDDSEDLDAMVFDEDLDSLVVDENETPSVQPDTSNAVQAFVTLIEVMKHLPMETQNMIVTQFAYEQKVWAEQKSAV